MRKPGICPSPARLRGWVAALLLLAIAASACRPACAATTAHYGGSSFFWGVSSFNGRAGKVIASSGDYSFQQISGIVSPSQLSQPLTGISPSSTPMAPSSGNYRIYFNKADGHWYGLSNSSGTINGPVQLDMPGVINATFEDPVTGVSQTATPPVPADGDYKFYFNSAAGHWYGISNTSGTVTGPMRIDGTTLTARQCTPGFVNSVSTDGTFTCGSVTGSNGGTVTSVGLSMPSHFTVTGSPVTGSGTISVTEPAQACASGGFVNGTDANGINTCATPGGGGATAAYELNFDLYHGIGPATTTRYFSSMNIDVGEGDVWVPVSIGGTAKGFYCAVETAPGTGYSDTFTLRVNGATPSGSPACTISGTATKCSDTTSSVSLTAGDQVDMEMDINGGAVAGVEECSIAVTE